MQISIVIPAERRKRPLRRCLTGPDQGQSSAKSSSLMMARQTRREIRQQFVYDHSEGTLLFCSLAIWVKRRHSKRRFKRSTSLRSPQQDADLEYDPAGNQRSGAPFWKEKRMWQPVPGFLSAAAHCTFAISWQTNHYFPLQPVYRLNLTDVEMCYKASCRSSAT